MVFADISCGRFNKIYSSVTQQDILSGFKSYDTFYSIWIVANIVLGKSVCVEK